MAQIPVYSYGNDTWQSEIRFPYTLIQYSAVQKYLDKQYFGKKFVCQLIWQHFDWKLTEKFQNI
jgi:hypothetical protein